MRRCGAFSFFLLAKSCACLVVLTSILAFATALAFVVLVYITHSPDEERAPLEKTASCSADGHSGRSAHSENEIFRSCSLPRSYSGVQAVVGWIARASTVQRALGLWPDEVSGHGWADDYVRS